jgi:hypothetical protein
MNAENVSSDLFPLGQVVITPKARFRLPSKDIMVALRRHAMGDWGNLDEENCEENRRSLAEGFQILSVYRSSHGVKFWIITEGDRSMTTVRLSDVCY